MERTPSLPPSLEHQEQLEEVIDIRIGKIFWQTLIQRLGIKTRISCPEFIRVHFKQEISEEQSDSIQQVTKDDTKKGYWIRGSYSVVDGSIRFNLPAKKIGKRLHAVIVHEIIHYAQDELEKYPEMHDQRNLSKSSEEKKQLPWEKEAYRLMNELETIFRDDCELIGYAETVDPVTSAD